jgi:leader peptidase (prepilin peptidase)/N-methyltransferase
VEALLGIIWAGLFLFVGPGFQLVVYCLFSAALLAISVIDYDVFIVPDVISLPGIVLGVASSFLLPDEFWKESLMGLLVGGGGLFVVAFAFEKLRGKTGMGMGDVKLLAMLGAFLGWKSLLFIVMFASWQGLFLALALYFLKGGQSLAEPEDIGSDAFRPGLEPARNQDQDSQANAVGLMGKVIPFGPFLALAAVEYIFVGSFFMSWLTGR